MLVILPIYLLTFQADSIFKWLKSKPEPQEDNQLRRAHPESSSLSNKYIAKSYAMNLISEYHRDLIILTGLISLNSVPACCISQRYYDHVDPAHVIKSRGTILNNCKSFMEESNG